MLRIFIRRFGIVVGMRVLSKALACLFMLFFSASAEAQEVRLKDLVNIRGVRSNQIMGLGLVVGLNKSGDSAKSIMTNRAAASLLTHLGMKIADTEVSGGSAAVVLVVSEMPAFTRNGDKLDVRVSVVGDAKSLGGGTLVTTPLKAGDGQVYAFAQGPVVIGQASGSGPQVQTVATVPGGASVEREFAPAIDTRGSITLSLRNPDFTTNTHIVEAINHRLHGFYAKSTDVHAIDVEIPEIYDGRTVEFIAEIESLRVAVDQKSVVIINERTGTVVMGGDVLISPVTISHGDLAIAVGGGKGGSGGKGKGKGGESVLQLGGTSVAKLIETMNAMGMKPADLVGVMQAIKSAGALQAELKFM